MKKFFSTLIKKFGVHPLFLAIGIGFILLGQGLTFLVYFSIVILHEFAHNFTAKKMGYKIDKIFLLPFGAQLKLEQNFQDENDEILIALSGPFLNFLLAIFCIALWWLEPNFFLISENFVYANLVIGTINLLPCYPLDGGRIFTAILSKRMKRKKSIKLCLLCNYLIILVFFALFLQNIYNFSYILFILFIFLGTFENKFSGNYQPNNFDFRFTYQTKKTPFKINFIGIKSDCTIIKLLRCLKQNKLNIIYILFEDNSIKSLSQNSLEYISSKYSHTTKFNEIFKKTQIF